MVRVLLKAGADVHADDDYALRWAAEKGHTQTVQILLANGANIHAKDDSPLGWAAYYGHVEIVKVLLSAGADVHAMDNRALRVATRHGEFEFVKVLAKHIFAPDSWRGKSRAEIESLATALYHKINAHNIEPERLQKAATILADCAIDCWHQVRPAPPKIQISPLPAQPRPV